MIKRKLNISNAFFYLFSLSTIVLLSWSLFKAFDGGIFNFSKLDGTYQSKYVFEELKTNQKLRSVYDSVSNDNFKKTYSELNSIKGKIEFINELTNSTNLQVNTVLSVLIKSSDELISLPSYDSIQKVLNNKIDSFETYVKDNKWRTLSRYSNILKTKVSRISKIESLRRVNRMISNVNSIESDLDRMKNITTNSILNDREKANVVKKVDEIKNELNLVSNYLGTIKKFSGELITFQEVFGKWIRVTDPEVSILKFKLDDKIKFYFYFQLGLIIFLVVSVLIGTQVKKVQAKRDQSFLENNLVKIVKEDIVSTRQSSLEGISIETATELAGMKSYLHNRMSFGALFQDGLPFGTILLDSNLSVIWANQLFYDSWNIDEKTASDGSLSWDFLQRFTNLGEEDPVLDSINKKMAGIYQIQVRLNDEEPAPFEMYVSPIEYAGQDRVLIMLYPLRSIEETLQNQSIALVGPVKRTLDNMINDVYDQDFKDRITKDFANAAIPHIFEAFEKLDHKTTAQRDSLVSQIEELEDSLCDKEKMLQDMNQNNIELEKLNKNLSKNLSGLKDKLIEVLDYRRDLENIYQKSLAEVKSLQEDQKNVINELSRKDDSIKRGKETLSLSKESKTELKSKRVEADELKSSINQAIDQVLIFNKSDKISKEELAISLSNIKNEIKSLDFFFNSLSKSITQFDVVFSKLEMIMSDSKEINEKELSQRLHKLNDLFETQVFNFTQVSRKADIEEEQLISHIKDVYVSLKEVKGRNIDNLSLMN